jgi:hypothetical protein
LKYQIPDVPSKAIDPYSYKVLDDEFYEVMLTVKNDVISSTVLYRPQGSEGDYGELDIWYGSLLDYVGDVDLKKIILMNLITTTKRDIEKYEDQLLGLTEIERDKRWIRRDLNTLRLKAQKWYYNGYKIE